jgi:hypothetical protein
MMTTTAVLPIVEDSCQQGENTLGCVLVAIIETLVLESAQQFAVSFGNKPTSKDGNQRPEPQASSIVSGYITRQHVA